MRRLLSSIAVIAVCIAPLQLATSTVAADGPPAYHVTKTVMLGAPGKYSPKWRATRRA